MLVYASLVPNCRAVSIIGTSGLASYAIGAVNVALRDLRGKLLGQSVYHLLGGKQKERIFWYASGNDGEWYQAWVVSEVGLSWL